jgi:hypothetical protein
MNSEPHTRQKYRFPTAFVMFGRSFMQAAHAPDWLRSSLPPSFTRTNPFLFLCDSLELPHTRCRLKMFPLIPWTE